MECLCPLNALLSIGIKKAEKSLAIDLKILLILEKNIYIFLFGKPYGLGQNNHKLLHFKYIYFFVYKVDTYQIFTKRATKFIQWVLVHQICFLGSELRMK